MKIRSTFALICLIIALLATSCTNKAIDEQLSLAESMMTERPDSALSIMNSIEPDELTGDRQKALYALLMTQAEDRNGLDAPQDDSLIRSAVEYFDKNGKDKKRLGRSYFYYGKSFHSHKGDESALQLYLKAKNALEKTDDYNYLSYVHQYIGRINDDRRIYSAALENYKKSVMYNEKFGETHRSIYSYRNMVWIYNEMGKTDSVKLYLAKVCTILGNDTLSTVYPSIARVKGMYEAEDGNYDKGIALINSAIRNEKVDEVKESFSQSLGVVYIKKGELDIAEQIFKRISSSHVKFYQSGAYYYLSEIEKKRHNYQLSLRYKEISDSISEIVNDLDLQNRISDMQKQNEDEKAEMERKMLVQQKRIELYGWALSVVCLVAFIIIFYRILRKQYHNAYRRKIKVRIDKELKLYLENKKRIEKYNAKIKALKQDGTNYKNEIDRLNNKLNTLVNENAKISSEFSADATDILAKLKNGALIDEYLSPQERTKIFDMADLLYGKFTNALKSECALNDKDVMFIVLLRLGFSTSEIATVFEYEESTIYKKKLRLKKRLKQSENKGISTIFG
jgi:hypothetical protein